MQPYVDVHCHINHKVFEGKIDGVIENARKAGVCAILVNGINPKNNDEVLALAKKYPDIVKPCLGLYPLDAINYKADAKDEEGITRTEDVNPDEAIAFIERNINNITAIGEVGLDYKFTKDDESKKRQKQIFNAILLLAKKYDKPILIHSRSAEADVLQMIEELHVQKAVLHCFGGKKSLIKKAAELGCSFSIPPVIARLQHFQTLVALVPLSQLLTETDSPWLGPRLGEWNEPANVVESVKWIATIKGLTQEEATNQIYLNYQRMFE